MWPEKPAMKNRNIQLVTFSKNNKSSIPSRKQENNMNHQSRCVNEKSANRPMCDDPKCQSTVKTMCSDKNCQETNKQPMKPIPKEYRKLCQDQTCQSTRSYKMISDPQKRQKIHQNQSSEPQRYKSGCNQ